MLIGYARVSTEDQLLDLQREALTKAGVEPDRIYEEHVSGARTRRPQLGECLRALREGDVLVVYRLDRLGRSVPELIKILDELQAKKIGFRSLSEAIDTTTAAGKMVFHMLAAFAEFERNLISERTKAGLKAARARGHRGGRKSKLDDRKMRAAVKLLEDPTVTMEEVGKTFGVSRATIYRAVQKSEAAKQAQKLKQASRRMKRAAKVADE